MKKTRSLSVLALIALSIAFAPVEAMPSLALSQTPESVFFFSRNVLMDDSPVRAGTNIIAKDMSVSPALVCGSVISRVAGGFQLMPCYMDDPTTPEVDGVRGGDRIQFLIDGREATQAFQLPASIANGDRYEIALTAFTNPETHLAAVGNLITCLLPAPNSSYLRVYRLESDGTWLDINPQGWGRIDATGFLKIDGLLVDMTRYGAAGHPYRVELWADGRLVRSAQGSAQTGSGFRIFPGADNSTPWACPVSLNGADAVALDVRSAAPPLSGKIAEYLVNGNFEAGFGPDGVAAGWTAFSNGGRARFGYSDETWQRAVLDGSHAQGLVIDSLDMQASDPDRYVGVWQRVTGLTPGATYRVTINAMMRTSEASFARSGYGYRVQIGIDHSAGTNWQAVANWQDIGMNDEYPCLSPGPYFTYRSSVVPTASSLTLFVRGWKKWGTAAREFYVDIDGLSLTRD